MAPQDASRRFALTRRQMAGLALLVLAGLHPREPGDHHDRFLVPRVSAPLWVAMLVSALTAVIAGALLTHRHDRD